MRKREIRPVIEAGSFQTTIGKGKTQFADKMKLGLNANTRATDVSRIGRNFRFD
jgi:hypothetical protein